MSVAMACDQQQRELYIKDIIFPFRAQLTYGGFMQVLIPACDCQQLEAYCKVTCKWVAIPDQHRCSLQQLQGQMGGAE